jgi:DNA polymerase III alpha subunit (gram-positive type)
LDTLCQHFKIRNDRAHRAKADAIATVSIFNHMLDLLRERDIKAVEDIIRFQKSRIPKIY